MNKIKVILADDHVVVRRGLRYLIDSEMDMIVIAEVSDGLQLLDSVEKKHPDVVLMDLKMPRLNGMDAAEEIRQRFPSIHTVILTMHADRAYIERAMQAGVSGYVLKEEDSLEMFTAIRHAAHGNCYLSRAVVNQLSVSQDPSQTRPNTLFLLTPRERQVFHSVVEGRTNAEIATLLRISVRTVERHRANLIAKLNIKSHLDLIRYAIKHGVIIESDQVEQDRNDI